MADTDQPLTEVATQTITEPDRSRGEGAPAPHLRADELVAGRYRVVRLLGRGGYGEVYEVIDTQRDVGALALKLHRVRRLSRGALEALKSEFALLTTLSHPNLARVYDFAYVEDEYALFTQDLIRGVPLGHMHLDPTTELGAHLLAQLCRALDYLHARGIVHGDIKPGNILIDEDEDRLVLLDLGVSRALGASTGSNAVGSPPFMAPELITAGVVDGRTDLYALGVTLYQLVSGRVPFRGSSTQVMMAHVEAEPPDLPPQVPLPLQALIARLIAKEPEHRPHSAHEVIDALARIAKVDLAHDTQHTLASHVLSAPLVGREPELEALLARAEEPSVAGGPLVLTGHGGSGKSRLIRELRQRVQLSGRAWVQVQTPRSSGRLLVPIARAILGPREVEGLSDEARIALARSLPELRRPRERLAVPLDPDRARARRLDILGELMVERFAASPGALVIEDLHWAMPEEAEGLIQLWDHLRAGAAPCFVLIASRPGVSPALIEALGAQTLACTDLSPEAGRALVASVFGDARVLDGTALGARIDAGASSALWLQESLRLAIEEGAIARAAGRFKAEKDVVALELTEVLAARVAQLPRDAKTVALASAVLAQSSSSAELCRVAGMKPARASRALSELVQRGVVERLTDGQGRARYVMHDRYADVVLQALPERRVRAARRRAGRWLARRDKSDFRGLGRAADELAAAGDVGRAIKALARARELAEQAGRPEQAAAYLDREIALRDDPSPRRSARLFDLAFACGRRDLVSRALSQLEEAARTDGGAERRVELALRVARGRLRAGETAAAREEIRAALDLASGANLDALACELVVLGGEVEYAHGDIERSLAAATDAASRARELERDDLEARAQMHCALVQVRFGNGAESTAAADAAVRAAKRFGEPRLLADAHRMLGNAHFVASRRRAALRSYRRAVKAARACGGTEAEAKALNNVAICAHAAGQVREALAAWRRAVALKESVGAVASALLTYASMSGVLNVLGELDEARRTQSIVLDAERGDARPSVALAWGNRGDTEMLSGEIDVAIDAYANGAELYAQAGMTSLRTHALAGRTRALLMRRGRGDLERADVMMRELSETQAEVSSREERRRFLTTLAMHRDARSDPEGGLKVARQAAKIVTPDTVFEDLFGSAVEARWAVALMLHRLGRASARDAAIAETRELLERRAASLDRPLDREPFMKSHPLHRRIAAGAIEPTPGCTWTIEPDN